MKAIKIAGMIEYPIFFIGLLDMCKKIEGIEFRFNTRRKNLDSFLEKHCIDILFVSTRESLLEEENKDLRERLLKLNGQPKPVIFIDNEEKNPVPRYYEAGFRSLIVKSVECLELSHAIINIHRSGHYVSQELSAGFFNTLLDNEKELEKKDAWTALTARELDVVHLIHREMSNNEIAEHLCISPRTVEVHRANIARKLGVRNSVGIVKYAIEHEIWTI